MFEEKQASETAVRNEEFEAQKTQLDEQQKAELAGKGVDVKLLEIDAKTGKMRLSMRALTEKPEGYVEPKRAPRGDRGPRKEGGKGGERSERHGNDHGRREKGGDNKPRRPRFESEEPKNSEPDVF